MLIGNSLPEYIFIRLAVPALRLIAPCAVVSCILIPVFRPRLLSQHKALWPLAGWAIAESAFFVGVYVPLRLYLQRPVVHPSPPTKPQRRTLYARIMENLPDPEYYLSRWFMNAPLGDIKRENLKEFYAWSLLNKRYSEVSRDEESELDSYVDQLEEKLDQPFKPGRGPAKSLRTTFDPVPMQHRPLLWYFIVFAVESFSSLYILSAGFQFHTSWSFPALLSFPFRLHSLTPRTSPSKHFSYWHRPHTASDKVPILFLHGIGIGAYTHSSFIKELSKGVAGDSSGSDIGVIALELSPISARICPPSVSTAEIKEEIRLILAKHNWTSFTLVAHSYGTAIASTLLQDPTFTPMIKATILMDPICFLLHLPDVAYNFTRRLPRRANERMLYYFASQDMMISHTLARRFFWNQLILFKQDLPSEMPLTVTLSGRDLIVPTREVWSYFTGADVPVGRDAEWQEGNLRVLWFDKLDHAGIFAAKGVRRGVAREGRKCCEAESCISSG